MGRHQRTPTVSAAVCWTERQSRSYPILHPIETWRRRPARRQRPRGWCGNQTVVPVSSAASRSSRSAPGRRGERSSAKLRATTVAWTAMTAREAEPITARSTTTTDTGPFGCERAGCPLDRVPSSRPPVPAGARSASNVPRLLRTKPSGCGGANGSCDHARATSAVARPKILRPSCSAMIATVAVRVASSRCFTRPENSIRPPVAPTWTGLVRRTL